MLENLHEIAVEKPRSLFGPLAWGVNKEEVAMQIAKIRASLPNELKQAVTVTRESERIVENAKEDAQMTLERAKREAERTIADARMEADRLIEQAREQQQILVSESEVLQIATNQGQDIQSSAEREASQIRRGAENYAFEVLCQVESTLGKLMTTIDRGKAEMQLTPENNYEESYNNTNGHHRDPVGVA